MADASPVESDAQRRRRLRQERILARGSDGLNRIRGTFSQVQDESDTGEMGMVGGHELKTSGAAHTAGISLDALADSDSSSSKPPRRRAGNLARKARQEAAAAAVTDAGSEGNARPAPAPPRIDTVHTRAGSMLDSTLTPEVADPAAESSAARPAPSMLGTTPSSSSSSSSGGGGGGLWASRRFSAVGLSRSIAQLVPVLGVFIYGLRREAAYEHLMGDSAADVEAKWTQLATARPDSRLDEWANGNFLLWYVIVGEAVLYGTYLALAGSGRSRSMMIPGIPAWTGPLLSVGGRILDSLAILLFLTAVSICSA
ncbi:hypothetical protein GGF46_000751 [Coemansia sp. RSA 552]|nr:hypothetical protein GGF46_000751 [Coemansia sp. RSA 552]